MVPMAQFEEKPVSSTRIRTALEGGDIPAANAMLGMPYAIRFEVQHGAGLGHTLGVPTINQLYPEGFQMPRSGIYITRTLLTAPGILRPPVLAAAPPSTMMPPR